MKVSLLTQIAPENRLLNRLEPEARNARSAFIAVSFIQRAGMKHLFKSLEGLLDESRPVTLFTSGYLGITDPKALEDLLRLSDHYETFRVFFNGEDRFHSKFFFFEKPGGTYSLFLGSSNVSVGGFADTGELNVHIRGKVTDAVCRDIHFVMANLEKNRDFEALSEDAILTYQKQHEDEKPKSGRKKKRARVSIPLEEMPIFVAECRFTGEECKRIEGKHPEWGTCVSYSAKLRRLKRDDHFLHITKLQGHKPMFTTSRYLEHDRISDVGTVAWVEDGASMPLSRLAKHLKIEEQDLLDMNGLDIYCVAILRRDFPQTFA